MPLQLCLATASDLLVSLRMPWVTNARASGDYAFCADSWDIGFASMLHWAVDVRPFKDVMWTTPRQPGSPYENTTLLPSMYKRCLDAAGRHAQPNVGLDALISAFSTGPVGLGDGAGYTDAALANATCRADGGLLPPAKPLTPLDRTWWPAARGTPRGRGTLHTSRGGPSSSSVGAGGLSLRRLLGSYSCARVRMTEGGGGGGTGGEAGTPARGQYWQYVVAIDTPCETAPRLTPARDLYWPRAEATGDGDRNGAGDGGEGFVARGLLGAPHQASPVAWYAVLRRGGGSAGRWWHSVCAHGERAYVRGSCVAAVAGEAPAEHVGERGELAGGITHEDREDDHGSPRRPSLPPPGPSPSPTPLPTDFVACSTPGGAFANGTHAWQLTSLAPVLPGPGWVVLGEADKFVGVSARRFGGVLDASSAARLVVAGIRGMAGEVLRLLVVTPPPTARVLKLEATLASATSECSVGAVSGRMLCVDGTT